VGELQSRGGEGFDAHANYLPALRRHNA
jgi:hypothetical protein